jgi:hypothetical protein
MLLDQRSKPYAVSFAVMFAVWLLAYVVGMVIGKREPTPWRRLPVPSKLLMIAMALGYALSWWRGFAAGTAAASFARWIILGVIAGGIGDLILADVLPLNKPVLAAMGVFGVGHLSYIGATFAARRMLGLSGFAGPLAALVVGPPIAVGVWLLWVRNPAGSSRLNAASLIYGVLIVISTGLAVELALEAGAMWTLALGLVTFTCSDLLLAQDLVRKRRFPLIGDVVWIIYSSAQVVIACSIGEAALIG